MPTPARGALGGDACGDITGRRSTGQAVFLTKLAEAVPAAFIHR
ncbi:hypothetical protein [Halobacillus litoralis]|nr:hypothetical protein [Halobacillus litoralis]